MRIYKDETADLIAYPLGGLGAGMIALEGKGAISHVSLRHAPEFNNEPTMFSAVCVNTKDGPVARVLEGPVPQWKISGKRENGGDYTSSNGLARTSYGLPRFTDASFQAHFPFARIDMDHDQVPLNVGITGWSPFIPGNADDSGLPVAAIDFEFQNPTDDQLTGIYSFHSINLMKLDDKATVENCAGGFVFHQPPIEGKPESEGAFNAEADNPEAVTTGWYRGAWFDALTMVWKQVASGNIPASSGGGPDSPGASIYVPFSLKAGETTKIRLLLSWYVPRSGMRFGGTCEGNCDCATYEPWYAGHFGGIEAVSDYWRTNSDRLYDETKVFTDCLHTTSLPAEIMEAVDANLTILKSPTLLRQKGGRLWGFEGCCSGGGCCHGTCTHVYNYVHAIAHLFPELERGVRESEFFDNQQSDGFQNFRGALPSAPAPQEFRSAADGQLGGIIKAWRDWRISGDNNWLLRMWPRIQASMEYCINQWDPKRIGELKEPHHNTYDIEFWGADGFTQSFYIAALEAAIEMVEALGRDPSDWKEILKQSRAFMEKRLYNGEYFQQQVQWEGLRETLPKPEDVSPEEAELLKREGPKYQYASGCLSDGILGFWVGEAAGLPPLADRIKTASHLKAVYRYNMRASLDNHVNPQRPGYAIGKEGGMLLCSWPKGDEPALPFVYSNEVWTGIEYEVASHLLMHGYTNEAVDIVRTARSRYDGRLRNPFAEVECGLWYVRALASYSLLYAATGVRYDAVPKTLHSTFDKKDDCHAFFAWDGGYGTAGIKDGKPFVKPVRGSISL